MDFLTQPVFVIQLDTGPILVRRLSTTTDKPYLQPDPCFGKAMIFLPKSANPFEVKPAKNERAFLSEKKIKLITFCCRAVVATAAIVAMFVFLESLDTEEFVSVNRFVNHLDLAVRS
jgi:hypothetical protein